MLLYLVSTNCSNTSVNTLLRGKNVSYILIFKKVRSEIFMYDWKKISATAQREAQIRMASAIICEKSKEYSKQHRKSYVIEPKQRLTCAEVEQTKHLMEFFGKNRGFCRG